VRGSIPKEIRVIFVMSAILNIFLTRTAVMEEQQQHVASGTMCDIRYLWETKAGTSDTPSGAASGSASGSGNSSGQPPLPTDNAQVMFIDTINGTGNVPNLGEAYKQCRAAKEACLKRMFPRVQRPPWGTQPTQLCQPRVPELAALRPRVIARYLKLFGALGWGQVGEKTNPYRYRLIRHCKFVSAAKMNNF
jgi:hypothetical protein